MLARRRLALNEGTRALREGVRLREREQKEDEAYGQDADAEKQVNRVALQKLTAGSTLGGRLKGEGPIFASENRI